MNQLDDIDQRRHALLKTARSAIRLRHSLEADAELNRVLPMLDAEFNVSLQRGVLPDVSDALRKLLLEE